MEVCAAIELRPLSITEEAIDQKGGVCGGNNDWTVLVVLFISFRRPLPRVHSGHHLPTVVRQLTAHHQRHKQAGTALKLARVYNPPK
jgi:hypothetical protein